MSRKSYDRSIPLYDQEYNCSECGRPFRIINGAGQYSYKCVRNQKKIFQCSYECYNHALLYNEKDSSDKYWDDVELSENRMRSHGKEIINPIIERKK